jgi:hypothetical protein
MIALVRRYALQLGIAGCLTLAAATGVFASFAFSAGTAQEPQRTVTINLTNGAQGPTGPAGPKGDTGPTGPAGVGGGPDACPAGTTFGKVVVNTPGGHVAFLTCIVDV